MWASEERKVDASLALQWLFIKLLTHTLISKGTQGAVSGCASLFWGLILHAYEIGAQF